MPSSVANAIPAAPKLASRMVPEGGFDSNSLTKKGAASALPRNDRRSVFTASFYFTWME
jgi:hypothetical protein